MRLKTQTKQPANLTLTLPSSSLQKRLYNSHRGFIETGKDYHEPLVMLIDGEMDVTRFEHVVKLIISRHDALRSSFNLVDGELVQTIHEDVNFRFKYQQVQEKDTAKIVEELVYAYVLEKAPLFRVHLIQISINQHLFVLDMHHLITDGFSRRILMEEIAKLYNGERLDVRRFSFEDYIHRRQDKTFLEILNLQKLYWTNQLRNLPDALNLPIDQKRPQQQNFQAETVSISLAPARVERLKAFATTFDILFENLFLALFKVLLQKITGQGDIIVGTPIDIRENHPMHQVVGLFSNPLPIRTLPENEKRFCEYLWELSAVVKGAVKHKDYLFTELIEDLSIPQPPGRHPLYDVFFVFRNCDDINLSSVPACVKDQPFLGKVTLYDLTFNVTQSSHGITIFVEYHVALFQRRTIEKLILCYIRLMEQIISSPTILIADLRLDLPLIDFSKAKEEGCDLTLNYSNDVIKLEEKLGNQADLTIKTSFQTQDLHPHIPDFCRGIYNFGPPLSDPKSLLATPVISDGSTKISGGDDPAAVYQTLLASDALRYLTLQMTAAKGSGHPGGFASQAEVHAALYMLGHKNIFTDLGHHAPGFYAAAFLDESLAALGVDTVEKLCDRYREYQGLSGHVSGRIPGLTSPAGVLGQGQHFAMAAAKTYPDILFPVTIGDAALAEPYIITSIHLFHTAFAKVTNFLPILVWNGYGQEYQSLFSVKSNSEMIQYFRGNGFDRVVLVDAKEFDDAGQKEAFVDSTLFSLRRRLEFTAAIIRGLVKAGENAYRGKLTGFIIKQIKGAGIHAHGVNSHVMSADQKLNLHHEVKESDDPKIAAVVKALAARALSPEAWELVRANFKRAGGGPAADVVVTEQPLPIALVENLPLCEYSQNGPKYSPSAAVGDLICHVGKNDPAMVVTGADENGAAGLSQVNEALNIAHPLVDLRFSQRPSGQVYQPVNQDACAGLTAALSLLGTRSLWCSCEAFAVNGIGVWQTAVQAMAELRLAKPSAIALFSDCALEQAQNGITHQRPDIENYLTAMIRSGNVYPLFPIDANSSQICYDWALTTVNKGIAIFTGKTPLPIFTTLDQVREAIADGAVILQEVAGEKTVVLATIGDMIVPTAFKAANLLIAQGIGTKIVAIVNPRRLYRPCDVAWQSCFEADGHFIDDSLFRRLFAGDVIIGATAGASGPFEPVMLRADSKRDIFSFKRGATSAGIAELMAKNGLTPEALAARAVELLNQ